MFDQSWGIDKPYCFDQVRLKVEVEYFFKQFCWFALKHYFALHITSLIKLKIASATFGIGEAIAPPRGYTPVTGL